MIRLQFDMWRVERCELSLGTASRDMARGDGDDAISRRVEHMRKGGSTWLHHHGLDGKTVGTAHHFAKKRCVSHPYADKSLR